MTGKIVYSAVAVPGEPDYDGETLTPEEIAHAAHSYLRDYRIVDPEHVCALGECRSVGKPVESYILTEPMSVKSFDNQTLDLPKGTWVIGIEVTDNQMLNDIRTGEKRGVSLTAKRADGVTKSKLLIRELGPDWVARTVSIVKNPAVPKARFFAIKSGDSMTENEETITNGFDRVIEAIKSLRQTPEEPEQIIDEGSPEEEEAVKYVTQEELEATKSEILEAIKTITSDEPAEEEEEDEESIKSEEETEEEEIDKDKKIEELEEENKKLKEQVATKSKGLPEHLDTKEGEAIKNLYGDDGRDMYGRVIR